jgi:hypothetical protein
MKPDSENFDSLRRLLALKRHEQPPPGYFNYFSRDVIARIRAGETGGEMTLASSWVERLLGMFDVKPVFAGAFGMAVCAVLISGVIASEQAAPAGSPVADTGSGSTAYVSSPPAGPAIAREVVLAPDSSNAVVSQQSLFDQFQAQPQLRQVSDRYWVPNGN